MRFNDKEIAKLCNDFRLITIEGVLLYLRPQGNDWSDWYQQSTYKERTFKLTYNLLFYYRINDPQPLGVFVLENVRIACEQPRSGAFYAFSITFNDGKHIFACRCEEDVHKWVTALRAAPYEHWRSQLVILRTKLSMRIGKDPVLDYMRNKQPPDPPKRTKNKSTFYTEIKMETYKQTNTTNNVTIVTGDNVPVSNLIDL